MTTGSNIQLLLTAVAQSHKSRQQSVVYYTLISKESTVGFYLNFYLIKELSLFSFHGYTNSHLGAAQYKHSLIQQVLQLQQLFTAGCLSVIPTGTSLIH